MTTLTDFLLARIAEDEAAVVCDHGVGCANQDFEFAPGLTDCNELNVGPRRWLAECEAKRRIVELHNDKIEGSNLDAAEDCRWDAAACPTLCALAAVYADHPDYRDEWRP